GDRRAGEGKQGPDQLVERVDQTDLRVARVQTEQIEGVIRIGERARQRRKQAIHPEGPHPLPLFSGNQRQVRVTERGGNPPHNRSASHNCNFASFSPNQPVIVLQISGPTGTPTSLAQKNARSKTGCLAPAQRKLILGLLRLDVNGELRAVFELQHVQNVAKVRADRVRADAKLLRDLRVGGAARHQTADRRIQRAEHVERFVRLGGWLYHAGDLLEQLRRDIRSDHHLIGGCFLQQQKQLLRA